MAKGVQKEPAHLEWLVRCRSQNQHTSLILYQLMADHIARLRKNGALASPGITLVAISFNLWRAVFLADLDDPRDADRVDHAFAFLKTLIGDNAIAYTQDRNARAWTFQTYLNNARYRLIGLSQNSPQVLPNFSEPTDEMSLKQIWEHYQTNTDLAVGNYANALNSAPQSN